MQNFSPGIYDGVPLEVYLHANGVSHSDLRLFSRSPAHYAARDSNPTPDGESETGSHEMLLRRAILSPDRFGAAISHRSYATHHSHRDARSAGPRGALPTLAAEEQAKLLGARDAVLAHPAARALLHAGGENDVSIFGCHPATGLTLRTRAHRLLEDAEGRPWIVEIKVCADVRRFSRSAREMRADVESAFSTDVLALAGLPDAVFVFIAVEPDPTNGVHGVRVMTLDERTLEYARALYESELARLANCEAAGGWPAHSDEIECIRV